MYVTYNKKAMKVNKEIIEIQKQQLNHRESHSSFLNSVTTNTYCQSESTKNKNDINLS